MPRSLNTLLAAALLAPGLVACDRDDLYGGSRFSENVYDAYSECSEAEIRFLAGKHNMQMVFDNCGSNNFVNYAWAPDGIQIYFQLPMSAHVMNAEDKTIGTMPTEVPTTGIAWLARDLMVLPLSPAEGAEQPRLVLFNRVQASIKTLEVPATELHDLYPTGSRDKVYFTALDENHERRVWMADFTNDAVTRAFPWLDDVLGTRALSNFTYTPELDIVTWHDGETVNVAKGADGERLHTFTDATRAIVHPEGRYIALETMGDPISPFDQRSWDELSDEAREREQRRSQEWLDRQPDWVMKKVEPPVIDIYDGEVDKRFRFTGFYGDRFQWYPSPYYASFVMWGIEGKELNKNVALTNLHERLRMAAKGDIPLGVELWAPKGAAPAEPAPAEPAAPAAPPE
ncbi:MAG: hypothetical protein H6739_13965 [Alphaproteobacteria bacterium]|nr:hypothetical protein [Alphaproteobacteria bacterium]